MQRIDLTHDFVLPVARVYAYLAEHEHLGPLFGATVRRLRDGDSTRNGVGSVRALRVGPLPTFEETVVAAVPDELIEYRISRGGFPISGHSARMSFSSHGAGTRLHYVITLGSPVPGLDRLIAAALTRNIRRGLGEVDHRA